MVVYFCPETREHKNELTAVKHSTSENSVVTCA